MDQFSVAIFSEQRLVILGTRHLLSGPGANSSLVDLPLAADCSAWLDAATQSRPDVILIDVAAPPALKLAAELRTALPDSRLIFLAANPSLTLARNAIDLGVRGILKADAPESLFLRCLERVAAGELWFDRTLREGLMSAVPIQLSPREHQLLILVARGCSNKDIAKALDLAEGTIKFYFSRLFRKCGVSDRLELALFGIRYVFHEPEDLAGPGELQSRRLPRKVLLEAGSLPN
jgi:two-component system nitrate/nitrite response regulator NarL